ncbi:hypothetical protein EJ05DRAFT_147214 [Pseudovirgaria hyperparasitica]|uniref:Uncharacterized protein n=1 Tax=Pseudovirgaria hyperparasitica TaxID=470096 RepID=A0A6A6VWU1_9PEZI|nr:uncharacterized protein EJ05DRAFT_147214 [Pseudovirgaria hyperparasitica]KAF2754635.1 hypothetical protein EJ05DRAFT_147214 [Pseudovirgaria hyperparasitica]
MAPYYVTFAVLLLANCAHTFVLPGVAIARPTNTIHNLEEAEMPSEATITPAPAPLQADALVLFRRQQGGDIDPVSLANVLLTGFPQSLRELAVTNIPAVSLILWSEFLDNNTPSWFQALPSDIQSYLSGQYGPESVRAKTTSAEPSSSEDSFSPGPVATTVVQTSMVTISPWPASSNPIESAAPAPTASPHNSGLTTAQKIGIGVGVPAGVAAIASLFLCCFLLRRRRQQKKNQIAGKDVNDRVPTPAFLSTSNRHPPMGERAENALLMHGTVPTTDGTREDSVHSNYYGYGLMSHDDPYAAAQATHGNSIIPAAFDRHNNPYGNISPISTKNGNRPSRRLHGNGNGNAANIAAGMLVAPPRRARNGTTRNSHHSSLGSLGSVPEAPEHAEYTLIPDRTLRSPRGSLDGMQEISQNDANGYIPIANGTVPTNTANQAIPPSETITQANGIFAGGTAVLPIGTAHGSLPQTFPSLDPVCSDRSTHPAFRPPIPPPSNTTKSPFADEYAEMILPTGYAQSQKVKQERGWEGNICEQNSKPQNVSYDSPTLGRAGGRRGEDWPIRSATFAIDRGRSKGNARLFGDGKEEDDVVGERRPLWRGDVYEGT